MDKKDQVIQYLRETYHPESILIYGSFVDGSNHETSDFDALIIADSVVKHDSKVIDGTTLDVFVYSPETFRKAYSVDGFLQVFDGCIVIDKNGVAEELKNRVLRYLEEQQPKTTEEIRQEIVWCRKMIRRGMRRDCEGYYRWHLLLIESLEIYNDARHIPWFGPNKAIQNIRRNDPAAYQLYSLAVKEFTQKSLEDWIDFIEMVSIDNLPSESLDKYRRSIHDRT